MLGDMSGTQEKAILTFMAKITTIKGLAELLEVVVNELPALVGAIGCWIYLQPEYVLEYHGAVRRGEKDITETDLFQAFEEFIVLAATNMESKKMLIGKAFFAAGEGISGWVYKNGKPLRINNVTNQQELISICSDLYWANQYNDGDELYQSGEERRLLAVPLMLGNAPIGTLKFHATLDKNPFPPISQEIATIAANIITGVLRQTWMVSEQNKIISKLIETSTKNSCIEVISDVTNSLREMLNCSRSEFYIKSDDGERVRLIARNGSPQKNGVEFRRGQSLIGWVYKTGLPLILPNIKQYMLGVKLDNNLLDNISNSHNINDEDRFLVCQEDFSYYGGTGRLQILGFMAVPVKSRDQEVEGVLCGYWNTATKMQVPNDPSQLLLAHSFSGTIALSLENKRQKDIGELLKDLGYLTESDQLFKVVVDRIPTLVSSSGCSIFELVQNHSKPQLELKYTSRKSLILDDGVVPDVVYDLGEGKTGICGYTQCIVIANHFGSGELSNDKLNSEFERINLAYPKDIKKIILDSDSNRVGLVQLQSEDILPSPIRMKFLDIANAITFNENGLVSSKLEKISTEKTWSFIAVPISSDHKLLGVITLARPTPNTPFLIRDVLLLKSISGRLASYMNNLRTLENRKRLVMTLAHEINTPLTGIMADSENIYSETQPRSDLQKLARHNLEQVLRLHMQASTIMSVLSDDNPMRQFSEHSIYRPLKEACELFESEALQKGCDILGPRARDGNFPKIEMSLFDLTIAIKNIIHNAVKYSFKPPRNLDKHRTIKVWGESDKDRDGYYVVCVQNYGVEITQAEIENRTIFKPYIRGEKASDKRRIGAGFGLAHAQMVIEDLHNGFIDVTSIHQGGDAFLTTFKISLPCKHSN
ncbi:MAG: GAF domain-containing protein [Chloroflexi bacterium]|nr:GAF domain-containing protein [Chloroflexota bacterium]